MRRIGAGWIWPAYYTGRGETPGRWAGRGLAGVDGLNVGDGNRRADAAAVRRGPPPARRNVARQWSSVGARCPVPAVDRGAAVPGGAAGPGSPTTTPPWAFPAVPPCRRRYAR